MNTSCFITVGYVQVTLFKIFVLGLFYFVWVVFYLSGSVCSTCLPGALRDKCMSDAMEPKLHMIMCCFVGTGTAAGAFARAAAFLASWPSLQPLKLFLILVI